MAIDLDEPGTDPSPSIDIRGPIGPLIVERVRLAAALWLEGDTDASLRRRIEELEAAIEASESGRYRRRIRDLFRIAPAEMNLLDLCFAASIDPRLEWQVAAGDASGPPVGPLLAADLFGHARPVAFGPTSTLAAWKFITPDTAVTGPMARYVLDPAIASALLGEPAIDDALAHLADPFEGGLPAPEGWKALGLAERVAALLESGRAVRLILRTNSERAGLAMARAVAAGLGTRVLKVSLPPDLHHAERADLFMRVQRLALIAAYAPCWTSIPTPWPAQTPGSLLQFVIAKPAEAVGVAGRISDLEWAIDELSFADRRTLLGQSLPRAAWERGQLDAMARTGGAAGFDDLAAVAAAAATPGEAAAILRRRIADRIGSAGVLMDQPYGWDDLVLPKAVTALLLQIPFEIRNRQRLLARLGEPVRPLYGGIATSALLCGPSGTGKTMAAQVIARDVGADLIRVDLAATVSKYIGETAKNLRRVFDQVAGTGAILLFDEADALFARRTEVKDAHDRHANADTNYLLQLIEAFDGAVLLATNKRDNIDPAFMRRIRHVITLPAPGPAERRRLWAAHLTQLGAGSGEAESALAADLAAAVDLSPAQIKNAAVTAAYAAMTREGAAISAGDLLLGLERELAKDGRALSPAERERLSRHA